MENNPLSKRKEDENMELHFEAVTAQNRAVLEALRVNPEQKGYIETVSECLAEASEDARWRPVGIYDGETAIGFAMYGAFGKTPESRQIWLDRFLIDRKYQGKGYGGAAIDEILVKLCREYSTDTIYLSVYDNNPRAIHMYQERGFAFNGDLDINGEKVMVCQVAGENGASYA